MQTTFNKTELIKDIINLQHKCYALKKLQTILQEHTPEITIHFSCYIDGYDSFKLLQHNIPFNLQQEMLLLITDSLTYYEQQINTLRHLLMEHLLNNEIKL
jgi:hypothetical protein